jgi:hypothetical protein
LLLELGAATGLLFRGTSRNVTISNTFCAYAPETKGIPYFFPGTAPKSIPGTNNTKEICTFANPTLLLELGAATGLPFQGSSRNVTISNTFCAYASETKGIQYFFPGTGPKSLPGSNISKEISTFANPTSPLPE